MTKIRQNQIFKKWQLFLLIVACLLLFTFSSRTHAEIATGTQAITSGTLSINYVDMNGNVVQNPSLTFSSYPFSYECTNYSDGPTTQISTTSQAIQIDNSTANPYVSATLEFTDPRGTWVSTVGGENYEFDANDNLSWDDQAPGCGGEGDDIDEVKGNMAFRFYDLSSSVVGGCNRSPSFSGGGHGFGEEGDIGTLFNMANGQACKINIFGGTIYQSIPAGQTPGTYTIGLTFTAV